jgi:hypothetical protein
VVADEQHRPVGDVLQPTHLRPEVRLQERVVDVDGRVDEGRVALVERVVGPRRDQVAEAGFEGRLRGAEGLCR